MPRHAKSRKQRVTEILGVSQPTAMHRLRKKVMFDLVIRLGMDSCFVCGDKIATSDDLSVEHKIPWMKHCSAELFWDMDNIAFSHLLCNRPHDQKASSAHLRKTGPAGTAWCNIHRSFLPESEFYENKRRWNGLMLRCKSCHNTMTNARKRRRRGVCAMGHQREMLTNGKWKRCGTCNNERVKAFWKENGRVPIHKQQK